MTEKDIELLVTLDDTGEDEVPETFNHLQPQSVVITRGCTHFSEIKPVKPKTANGCEECLATGDEWVHLRLCESCGHVGCCNSSKNKHSIRHFLSTEHPIVRSFEPGEDWRWCHVDETFYTPSIEVMH